MAGRRLDGGARIRRATRHDLPGVRLLMADPATPRAERFDRRMLRDLGGIVSVVEDAQGRLVAAMSLVFVRSFLLGRWQAHLDGLWVSPGCESVVEPMVEVALAAAARRHCHALHARRPLAPPVVAALERRGACAGQAWCLEVPPLPEHASARGRRRRA